MSYDLSIDDAFGLSIIAKFPQENKDLIPSLVSPHARQIAENIVDPSSHSDNPDICHAAACMRKWASHK